MNKILLFWLAFIITNAFAQRQYPVDTIYQSIHTPAPALPPFLGSISDNSVPTPVRITRISDYYAPDDWYPTFEYAKIQTWNTDQTLYKIRSVWVVDAQTHQIVRNLPGSQIYPAYWSNTDPDKLFSFRANGDILEYSVSQDSIIFLMNVSNQYYEFVKLGPGEGNIDINDKYVALTGKHGTDMDVIVVDLEHRHVVHTETFPGAWGNGPDWAPDYVDWVSVSQSGDYVGIMWNTNTTSENNPHNGHYGVEIYNTSDMTFLRRIASYGDHGDFGFDTNGEEVFVQFWGETGTVNMYYLDRAERTVVHTHQDFNSEGHISCRNIHRPGWAYITISYEQHSGQMVAVKLDGSETTEHFGHHFSSSTTYDKHPMGVASPYGDMVMFKSDFGNSANADEVYIFTAKVDNTQEIQKGIINTVSLYPNPAIDFITLESREKFKSIFIFNTSGQVLLDVDDINSFTSEIDISALTEGIYFIQAKTVNDKVFQARLIKM